MQETRITIKSIDANGSTFIIDDPAVWTVPMQECSMVCRVVRPIAGEISIFPQDNGCLVKGHLQGEIILPCDRCAEDAHVVIDQHFTSFEPFPADMPDAEDFDGDLDRMVMHLGKNGNLEIDLGALLWEEFVLALPVKPLCRPDCKGICPVCGQNLNQKQCSCSTDNGDSRMAVLRTLHIKK